MKTRRSALAGVSIVSLCHLLVLPSACSEPRQIWPPWPEASLGNYRWNQPIWLEHRTVNEDSAAYAESWSGYALRRDSLTTALPVVIPGGIVDGRSRLPVETGAVRFWVAPNWSSVSEKSEGAGPEHFARLLELVNWSGAAPQTHWSLYVSEDGSAIYFSGVSKGGATDFLKVPIAFEAGEWWAVTVCYSPTNSALWLNDQLVAEGEGVAAPAASDSASFGFVIGSDIGAANPAEAQFDDLTVFDYWPGEKQQAAYYKAVKKRAILGPVGTEEEEQAKQELVQTMMEPEGSPPVPGEGGGGEGEGGVSACGAYDYPSNMLWLEITGVSHNLAYLIIHGTVEDVAYEILSLEQLTNTLWASEGMIIGAAGQDWTPTAVTVGARTNSLYLWAKSWADSDGDGLPDWYEIEVAGTDPNNPDTGETGLSDGYKDSDNDGWTTLQEYQNGTSPNEFDLPPSPHIVLVQMGPGGNGIRVEWVAGAGPVSHYEVVVSSWWDPVPITNTVSASTHSYTNANVWDDPGFAWDEPKVRVVAHYANGATTATDWHSPAFAGWGGEAFVLRGPQGQGYLAVQSPVANLEKVRVFRTFFDVGVFEWASDYFDIYATNLVNGLAPIDLSAFADSFLDVQWWGRDGQFGPLMLTLWWQYAEDAFFPTPTNDFVNAAAHLKQNLLFLLRAATVTEPFGYMSNLRLDGTTTTFPGLSPRWWYSRPHESLDYVYYGYRHYDPDDENLFMRKWYPVQENHLYRNFVYSDTEPGNGNGYDYSAVMRTLVNPHYQFQGNLTAPPPGVLDLAAGGAMRVSYRALSLDAEDLSEVGLYQSGEEVYLAANARNLYGLPIHSVLLWNGVSTNTAIILTAGGPGTPDWVSSWNWVRVGTAAPQLETVDYYFATHFPYDRYEPGTAIPPKPGMPEFSPTNAAPVLILPVGQPGIVAGWAKQAITNGYAGKFAYLEQYFDKAFTVNTNGAVTTNLAGLLSPYGEFFPTEPGPAALVTLPDLDTGERGTCMVHVIKLQLDVNHDGVMDLSFGGPYNTSANRPFVFWANNDYDRVPDGGIHGEEDDLASSDSDADSPDTGKPAPDSEYRLSDRIIPSLRDLEDFARLWISGITTNLYPSLPAGVTAELSWGDKGSPNPNNPTIDIFGTPEIDGGIGYLTNLMTGLAQTNSSWYGDRLGPGDSMSVVFSNSAGWQHWSKAIWCGVKKGSGKLTLTFSQGTNTIAEASTYIEVKDIKEMYERWTVGDHPQMSPTNKPYLATEDLPVGTPPFEYTPPTGTNTPYILLVHDYDLPTWKKDRYAETAYKRLYWQGYEGRFGFFRWPGVPNSPRPLDDSEFNAWQSAAGLLNRLTNLHAQYPGNVYLMAHGYGAIAAGEALRLAGTNYLVNTYIAMQGAVAAHAYDSFLPWRSLPPGTDDGTPNRYLWYSTNGAPPYFWGVGGASTYINYFNTNNNVLTNDWRSDQNTKPALPLSFGYQYHWDGTNFLKSYFPGLLLLFPVDRYEIFSYCVEARCEAIGAQPNLGGPFNVNRQLNLSTLPFPVRGVYANHDGQFKSFCADTWAFWRQLLGTKGFGLKP